MRLLWGIRTLPEVAGMVESGWKVDGKARSTGGKPRPLVEIQECKTTNQPFDRFEWWQRLGSGNKGGGFRSENSGDSEG
jgi:hypothetical protein